jgi:hypothetical protein
VVQPVVQAPERTIIVQQPAAPPETQPMPPAPTGYTWVPGHYVWRGNTWVWEPGQWRVGAVPPMPANMQETIPPAPIGASRWVPGYWVLGENSWTWVKGRWV